MYKALFILSICLLSVMSWAETLSGVCGDSLSWSFDTETQHLDITGKGKMNLTRYPAWTRKDITICSVSLSDSMTSIDSYAFEEQSLREVFVPASVKKFGSKAFANNQELLRFEYGGEGYCETGDMVLYNCHNLRYFRGATKMLAYNDALDTVIVTYGYALTNFYERSYIDNTLAYDTRLTGKYDEREKKIRTFFFPNEILAIGDYLLCNAVHLGGTQIPAKAKTIGKAAFFNCTSMDSLIFMGDAIESIGDSAFCNCHSITKIALPDSLPPVIKAHTFEGVDRSIPIYVPVGAAKRYSEAPYWSEFVNYIEPSPTTHIDVTQVHNRAYQKQLHNGRIIILSNGQIYNSIGQKIK